RPVGGVEYGETQPSDRAGDAAAVAHEIVERLIGGAVHVLLDAGYEVGESVERKRKTSACVAERGMYRVVCPWMESRYSRARRLELAKLLIERQRAVPDVVDAASERVDSAHRASLVRWKQANPVVEVRGLRPGHVLAMA